jgi:hypothetical protein
MEVAVTMSDEVGWLSTDKLMTSGAVHKCEGQGSMGKDMDMDMDMRQE